jgi:hypothetical protein
MYQRKTVKVTRQEAAELFASLQQIGNKPLVCWYPISRNISTLKPITKQSSNAVQDMINAHALKDENGNWKTKVGPGGQTVHDFGDMQDEIDNSIKELEAEEVKIEVRMIPLSHVVNKDKTSADLPANVMAPLLDVIIYEDEEPVENPSEELAAVD